MSGRARGRTGAGASAQAEFERRSRQWKAQRRRALRRGARFVVPVAVALGGYVAWRLREFGQDAVLAGALLAGVLITAAALPFLGSRVEITAWRTGAAGEAATARKLRRMSRRGWVVFHDRAIPGSRANLDHIAVGPPGVVYIDSKNWTSKTARVRVDRRTGTLWYGRYPQDRALATAVWEADQVRAALARAGVAVQPHTVLAVHGAALPRRRLRVAGVSVVEARRLRWQLRRLPATHSPDEVAALAAAVERHLPAYTA